MGKPNAHDILVQQEFASLEKVLDQSADDATRSLKLLKKNLSEYDSRHGNHFINTASSYMRSDMRTAKDTALEMKQVAHDTHKCTQPSESEIVSARNMMSATAKAMDHLNTTARNYDHKNGQSKVVESAVDNNDREKDEKHIGLLGGKKHKDEKRSGLLGGKTDHHHGVGVLRSVDTVEELTRTTLRDNFNVSPLSHQITIADKSLSATPSFVEHAKEAVHDVKEKLKGDKASSTHDSNTHGVLS